MSRLQQYLFLGGMLALLQWTSTGFLLQSPAFLRVVAKIIAVLLIVAVLVTWPRIKKKWRERQERLSGEDEGKNE